MAALLTSPAVAQTILLNDTFADGNVTNQALPGSSAWYALGYNSAVGGTSVATMSGSSNALTLTKTNSFAGILTYFTDSGTITLAEGQSLSLQLKFTTGGTLGTADNGLRFGLFNSGGNRLTSNVVPATVPGLQSGTTFSGWRGYELTTRVGSGAPNTFRARERTGSGSALWDSAQWTALSGSTMNPVLAPNTEYNLTLTLERTATSVDISASFAGRSFSFADTSGLVTSFDAIGIFGTDVSMTAFTIDDVQLSLVPEPSVFALLGCGFVTLAGRRRKRAV